jgi:hypothetical protein
MHSYDYSCVVGVKEKDKLYATNDMKDLLNAEDFDDFTSLQLHFECLDRKDS